MNTQQLPSQSELRTLKVTLGILGLSAVITVGVTMYTKSEYLGIIVGAAFGGFWLASVWLPKSLLYRRKEYYYPLYITGLLIIVGVAIDHFTDDKVSPKLIGALALTLGVLMQMIPPSERQLTTRIWNLASLSFGIIGILCLLTI